MKFFITGCAKSGTTLVRRMFYAFDNIQIIDNELSLDKLIAIKSKKHLVGKRSYENLLSSILDTNKEKQQVRLIKQNNIFVINCIRDGRDVIEKVDNTRFNKRPSWKRWVNSIDMMYKYSKIINLNIFYEELVDINKTNNIQQQLIDLTNLKALHKWSEYPNFIPGPDQPIRRGHPRYELKPLHTQAINRHHKIYNSLTPEQKQQFDKRLSKLGYI